jgi:hypothetical protein
MSWRIVVTDEFTAWFQSQDQDTQDDIQAALELLAEQGPELKRPVVGKIEGSNLKNMKEVCVGTVRILFAFGPNREAVLLVAGDKEGEWNKWYRRNIRLAERLFAEYVERGRKK